MFNWHETEEWARSRYEYVSTPLSERERYLLEFLKDRPATRQRLRARLATALVRVGHRLDPHAVVLHQSEDALFEGRLAAYLR